MAKRGRFWKALVLILFLFILEFAVIFYAQEDNAAIEWSFSSILNYLVFTMSNLSTLIKILFIIQSAFSILVLVLFLLASFRKEAQTITIHSETKGTKTDIDTLYEGLQEKRQIKLSNVAKKFKIDKEVALDWFRILEDAKLAEVIYPSFGEPRIKSYIKKQEKSSELEEFEEIKVEDEKTTTQNPKEKQKKKKHKQKKPRQKKKKHKQKKSRKNPRRLKSKK